MPTGADLKYVKNRLDPCFHHARTTADILHEAVENKVDLFIQAGDTGRDNS